MTTVRARTVFSDDKRTVTAIESLQFQADKTSRPRHATVSPRPIAVIVREQGMTCALEMDAQPVDIDRLDLPADFELEQSALIRNPCWM